MNLAMISDISDYTSEFTSSEQEETDDADDLDFFKCSKIKKNVSVGQFASEIVQFSSQYGSDNSISYVADNMTGKPCKFPDFGDFPEVYAMRTYSDWWEQTPSYKQGGQEYAIQNIPQVPVHDFIVVEFEYYVIPKEIRVYETYNPGALVRIWAYNITEHWEVLWEGRPEVCSPCARIFSPPLCTTNWPTKTLRLEFNHSKLDYFTQIDACLLIGEKYEINEAELNRFWAKSRSKSGAIAKKLEKVGFVPQIRDGVNPTEAIQDFFENGINSFIKTRGGESPLLSGGVVSANASLNDLPYEIIFKILTYLDLKTVFRLSEVCKNLYCVATDPLLYTELNLKPFWNCATSAMLTTLSSRCRLLRKLDLSWCGLYNSISSRNFNEFIQACGTNLTHIRLNTCKFLNGSCLEMIVTTCPGLKELAIRNYLNGTPRDFHCLSMLRHLERLDLFRTSIDASSLLNILRNNPNLRHLNLAFSPITLNMDQVALGIAQYNKKIVSIDMWKSKSLTSVGINALSECHDLEEVDFGWCLRDEASPGEALKLLLQNCPRLKKLFLASIRGLTDRDLENVALYCSELEQLDLMGILGISTEICYKILTKCRRLKMIDISFCQLLDNLQIDLWRDMFDLSIKRSFLDFAF